MTLHERLLITLLWRIELVRQTAIACDNGQCYTDFSVAIWPFHDLIVAAEAVQDAMRQDAGKEPARV